MDWMEIFKALVAVEVAKCVAGATLMAVVIGLIVWSNRD